MSVVTDVSLYVIYKTFAVKALVYFVQYNEFYSGELLTFDIF